MMTFSYLAVATTLWKQQGNMIGDQHSQRNATRDVNMLTGRKKVLRNHIFGLFTFLGEQNRREIQISFHFKKFGTPKSARVSLIQIGLGFHLVN